MKFPLLLLLLPTLAHAAPLCLPEATAVALAQVSTRVDALVLARELPVHADGVDLFDLRLWLEAHKQPALVLEPQPQVLEKLAKLGLPLILVRAEHAVALTDLRAGQVLVTDNGQAVRTSWLAALRGAKVALVLWENSPKQAFTPAEWRQLTRLDADFLASGWLRRALEVPAGAGQNELARRALLASPCYLPAQKLARQLGVPLVRCAAE